MAVVLRLGQSRTVKGPKGETSRGLRYLDCAQCPKAMQRARGCHRFGQRFHGPDWRIDFTGDVVADTVTWCPASIRDEVPPSFTGALSRMLRVEAAGGTLASYGTPHFLMPSWWVTFFEASLSARDRFLREIEDAYHEVS